MMTLVTGGAASGKSAYAESLICGSGNGLFLGSRQDGGGAAAGGRKLYLATMQPFGKEAEERIRKHRAMRAGKGFETAECGRAEEILKLLFPPDTAVLLEDVGNLCANELFREGEESGSPETRVQTAADAVIRAAASLASRCRELVIVTNEVHSGGAEYEGETLSYLRLLGQVNIALAEMADRAVEVQCGVPVVLKGPELPQTASAEEKDADDAGIAQNADDVSGTKQDPGRKRTGMVFVTGPMFSGKRAAAAKLLGKEVCSISEVQTLAAECRDEKELEELADRLSEYELVISSETGCGVVPADPETRSAREKAGRLNCLLAARAETVIRVFCGIPQVIKGQIENNGA